ncbi:MAG TPA: ABC transporter ATP-binding protein [Actinomycetota bacterium]|nr:ABC transporter ATP-binding protein [Actinomycetota bacterium]
MDDAQPVLWCRDLRKAFGDLIAVDGVGFHIAAGETYGLLGPNGAGKTTTISMICGLLDRDGGEVLLEGHPLDPRAVKAKAAIGYVPQELALYPDLTGRENLRFFGRLYALAGRDLEARVDEVLSVIDLQERADDRVEHYSGGMQRRLNIGLGLLNRPSLLVLDEPTVGVDPQSRNAILSGVERFRGLGMAVLYTTHYMEEAERLCDRVGIIDHGQLKAEGTRRELVAMVGERDRVSLAATGDLDAAERTVEAVGGVEDVSRRDGGLEVVVREAHRVLPAVLSAVAEAGAHATSVEIAEPNLEAVFLHLTGRALRE